MPWPPTATGSRCWPAAPTASTPLLRARQRRDRHRADSRTATRSSPPPQRVHRNWRRRHPGQQRRRMLIAPSSRPARGLPPMVEINLLGAITPPRSSSTSSGRMAAATWAKSPGRRARRAGRPRRLRGDQVGDQRLVGVPASSSYSPTSGSPSSSPVPPYGAPRPHHPRRQQAGLRGGLRPGDPAARHRRRHRLRRQPPAAPDAQ